MSANTAILLPRSARNVSDERMLKLQDQSGPKEEERSRGMLPSLRPHKLSDLVQKLPERSAVWEGKIPLEGESLAAVVEEARREVRAWQKRVASGKRDYSRPLGTNEKPEEEKRVGNGGGQSRGAGETSDFGRSVETSPRRKSGIADDETAQTRGKSEARKKKSDFRLEKDETSSTSPLYSDDATDAIRRTTATTATVMSSTTKVPTQRE